MLFAIPCNKLWNAYMAAVDRVIDLAPVGGEDWKPALAACERARMAWQAECERCGVLPRVEGV